MVGEGASISVEFRRKELCIAYFIFRADKSSASARKFGVAFEDLFAGWVEYLIMLKSPRRQEIYDGYTGELWGHT